MKSHVPAVLQQYLSQSRVKAIPRNQIVQYEGDKQREVYFIRSGFVKVHNIDDSGSDKVLHILSPDNVMPFAFFSGRGIPTKWFYTTMTDCELYVLDRQDLDRLLFDNAEVGRHLVYRFSQEVHEILVRLDSLGKSDIPFKLRAALTYLVVCHGERLRQSWWKIPFAVNHQLLADMIGVTRESAAIAIKQLADKGIVRYPRVAKLEINYAKLKRKTVKHSRAQSNSTNSGANFHSGNM
jgi:CRP/FNR family transcriptional regulator